MVTLLLLALTYISAVRIAASGELGAGRSPWLDRGIVAAVVIGAFTIASLKSAGFMIDVFVLVSILALFHLSWFVGISTCSGCSRRPWASLILHTRCECGVERLPYLRSCVSEPYCKQLRAAHPPEPLANSTAQHSRKSSFNSS
jgi:hypothetical protein